MVESSPKSVTLHEILQSREDRSMRQGEWLNRHSLPLVSFTINIPGTIKQTEESLKVFYLGYQAVIDLCESYNWTIVAKKVVHLKTGSEALFAIESKSAIDLKCAMIRIEDNHKLGRFMDLDVMSENREIISRVDNYANRRKCYLCDEDAVVCARSKKHKLEDLLKVIKDLVNYD